MGGAYHTADRTHRPDYLSPPGIIQALPEFDLDPCCPAIMPWATARIMWSNTAVEVGTGVAVEANTQFRNGLKEEWREEWRVYLNPPFGDQAGVWLKKLAAHGNGIALIYARTETQWFIEQVWEKAKCILFLKGRPKFHDIDGKQCAGNSGGPLVLVAYGKECSDILEHSTLNGARVVLWHLGELKDT